MILGLLLLRSNIFLELLIEEINKTRNYIENRIEKNKDVVSLVLGGPTKHYNYSDRNMINIFSKINKNVDEIL